jgi:hypothetical protein
VDDFAFEVVSVSDPKADFVSPRPDADRRTADHLVVSLETLGYHAHRLKQQSSVKIDSKGNTFRRRGTSGMALDGT